MKIKEIRDKENSHLEHELIERQKHMFDLRTQGVTEKLEDPSQLRKARRDIAQIRTILRQRQIEQAKAAKPESQPAATIGALKPAKSRKSTVR